MAGQSATDWLRTFAPYLIPVPAYTESVTAGLNWFLEFAPGWAPYILGTLKVLARPETWSGTDTDIASAVREAMTLQAQILERRPGMPIGSIFAYATTDPPAGSLACDGSTYLRVDWPALYAVLASAFIADADHFTVPDLRGRTVLGTGTGSGLTARSMNGAGGVETHALSVAEMPAHNHANGAYDRLGRNTTAGSGTLGAFWVNNQTVTPFAAIASQGSGSAHENMQPWRALGYAIVAE